MRLLFIINTPSQAYTWQNIIRELTTKGHSVCILARDQEGTVTVLKDLGFQFLTFKSIGTRLTKLIAVFEHFRRIWALSRNFNPSMVIGFGVDAAVIANKFKKPCIVFTDGETTIVQNNLTKLLANVIVTPDNFKKSFGKNHIRIKGYKELAYLHPNYYKPDSNIYKELKIGRDEKYVILRFNSFNAIHDIGEKGFSNSDKIYLVRELEKYTLVFIASEDHLPLELEKKRLRIPFTRIHHVLYYSQIIVSDGGTMITEGAMLGTPGIICHPRAKDFGVFTELEQKYGLIKIVDKPFKAVECAIELIQQSNVKDVWAIKRQIMLEDKIDVTRFMVDLIENYPQSLKRNKT